IRSYLKQFIPLRDYLKNAKGDMTVLVNGGPWRGGAKNEPPALIRHVPKDGWKANDLPSGEEMWYAQEDIWLQGGILATVAKANQYVAQLKKVKDGSTGKEQDRVFTFYNPSWQLDIKRTNGNQITGTLTNISNKRLRLDISFMLQVSKAGGKNDEPRKA